MRTELAGYCGVGSGQIMVIDPCYAFMDDYSDKASNYRNVCEVSKSDNGYGEFPLPANGYHFPIGVVTSSGYGDGNYPVFVDINEEGRIVELRICFGWRYRISHDELAITRDDEEEEVRI